MLKRVLLLTVVAVASLVLMAFDPPNDDAIDGTEVDCAATYITSDGIEVCLFYLEAGGGPGAQVGAAAEVPPAEVQNALNELPPGLLNHLPENVKAGFQAMVDGNGHLMSEITNCTHLLRPLKQLPHRKLSTSGSIYCSGSDVLQVRYKIRIERKKFANWWNLQGSDDTGWRNGRYAGTGVVASCASGEHTYRARGVGAMKSTDGGTYYSEKYSRTRRTTCAAAD